MDKRTCQVQGCNLKHSAKGYCYKHYRRARRRAVFAVCAVDGCDKGQDRTDMCTTHYMRSLRGTPLDAPMRQRFNDDLSESFAAEDFAAVFTKVKARAEIKDGRGCWEYPRVNGKGYGELWDGEATRLVHRLMAELSIPNFDPTMQVHHTCANRSCCNPAHLQVLSSRENRAEMLERKVYRKRIADLERALREIDREHPLLKR